MKKAIILVVLISFKTFSQKFHTGTYFIAKKDVMFEAKREVFSFGENGEFKYFSFGSNNHFGKGKYQRTKEDSLNLFFEDCESYKEIKDLIFESEKSDSVEIDLKILSQEDSVGLGGSAVFSNNILITNADENGNLRIKLPKLNEEKNLNIGFIGYYPVKIKVKTAYSKISGIVRIGYDSIYDNDENMTLKIIAWNNRRLKLKRYEKYNISYIKVNQNSKVLKKKFGEYDYEFYQHYFSKK